MPRNRDWAAQAQRLARLGANAQPSISGRPGFAAQAQAPRPDFQAPRTEVQAPVGDAQKLQAAMQPPLLTGPPVLLRPNAAQGGALPAQPGAVTPQRQQQGLPQAPLMQASAGQELSQQPLSSAEGLPPPPSSQMADQVCSWAKPATHLSAYSFGILGHTKQVTNRVV